MTNPPALSYCSPEDLGQDRAARACPVGEMSRTLGGPMFRRMSLSLLSAAVVAGTLVMLVPQAALAAPPANPDPGVWSADGKVYSLAHANGVVYAGGTF